MTTVCSGFSPAGYVEYGRNFLDTFDRFWPKSVKLMCYVETRGEEIPMPRGSYRSLWNCPGAAEFISKHKNNRAANGREPNTYWREKHIRAGYHFGYDAVKFCRQCFIPEEAATWLPDGELLAWSDADVLTLRPVPEDFVERLLGDGDICYLGREGTHPEIGFWAVRLNRRTRNFLIHFANMFRCPPGSNVEEVFRLEAWHSAFVFDYVLKKHVAAGELVPVNLSPKGVVGNKHVWHQTELGRYLDHLKGDSRKRMGRSPERRAS